jgi:hypothetical protein
MVYSQDHNHWLINNSRKKTHPAADGPGARYKGSLWQKILENLKTPLFCISHYPNSSAPQPPHTDS